MDTVSVSILIPAFNAEKYIDECLKSIRYQTLKDLEIIVMDDGSMDRTNEIVQKYATIDNRVRILHQSHHGIAATRNALLNAATGTYISFVDSDDYIINADTYKNMYLQAETNQADIVLGSVLHFDNETPHRIGDKSKTFPTPKIVMAGKDCFCAMMKNDEYSPIICGNLYRREMFCQHQIHFECTAHDFDYFTPYALYAAERVIYYPYDFYYYRQHEDSIMHSKDKLRERAESLSFIEKELRKFIDIHIVDEQDCDETKQAYRNLATKLNTFTQDVYEEAFANSSRKCLFIISGISIGNQYGVGTYVSQLAQCFSSEEWDINIISLHSKNNIINWKFENQIAYYEIPTPLELQTFGADIDDPHYYRGIFYYFASHILIQREVYCHFNFARHYHLALLFKENLKAKILFTLHYTEWSFELLGDRERMERILDNPYNLWEKKVIKTFEFERKFMIDCCDCIIAIARHSYDMLKELYSIPEEKITYIPNGLNDELVKYSQEQCSQLKKKFGFEEKERLIIFAGRLNPVKGILELIEAFGKVIETYPNVKLIIAGSGGFESCFEVATPFWSHIVFTGFISKELLFELYAIAEFGVVPSIHEEFGYVATEMMMNKLPILVNKTTGLSEIVMDGKYGTTFEFGKERIIENLKEALVNMLSKENLRCCSAKGRERMLENYSLHKFRKRIMDTYNIL